MTNIKPEHLHEDTLVLFMALLAVSDTIKNARWTLNDGEEFGFSDSLIDAASAAGMDTEFLKMGWDSEVAMISSASVARAAIERLTGRCVIGASRQIRATAVENSLLCSTDTSERVAAHYNILTVGRVIAGLLIPERENDRPSKQVLASAINSALKNVTFADEVTA